MASIMKLFGRLFFALLMVGGVISCGENSALKEETLYLKKENKGWLAADSLGYNFILVSNHGIAQSFVLSSENYEFNKSWGSFLGVNTDMTYSEYHYQAYSSNYGVSYSSSLTAGFKPFGDDFYVELDRVGFAYDFKFKTLSRITANFGYKSKLMTDKGYETQGEEIYSAVEILSTYSTQQNTYDTVLYFRLNDFKEQWNDFTVTDIYIAKNTGLIKYKLNSGVAFERE